MSKFSNVIETGKKLAASLDADPKAVAKEPGAPAWVGQVAMLTGALAALAGFLTVQSTKLTNQAIYESNQAILLQTQASDAWSEYQADSIKAHIAEIQLLPSNPLNAADKAKLQVMDNELRARQPQSKQIALDNAKARQDHLGNGMVYLAEKDWMNYASMAAQLGIALASAAALTRKRSMFHASLAVAVLSAIITAYAFLMNYLHS